jgi:hypothetical protein
MDDNCDEIFNNILNQLNEIKIISLDMTEKLKISENKIQNFIENLTIINDFNDNDFNDVYKLKNIYNSDKIIKPNDFNDNDFNNNDFNDNDFNDNDSNDINNSTDINDNDTKIINNSNDNDFNDINDSTNINKNEN